MDLGAHQLKALRELNNGSILTGGVGTGKSRTALAYFFIKVCGGSVPINGVGVHQAPVRPRDLVILTTAKKRDSKEWSGEASDFALTAEPDESYGGIGVTVDSWNNIRHYVEIRDAFFIFDEQRLVGSGAWVKSFLEIVKHNQWILLSATPGDTWSDYIPVFLAHGFYKNRTAFLREHAVFSYRSSFPKIERYVETGKLEKYRRSLLVDMPYQRHTTRHVQTISVDFDKVAFQRIVKDRWNIYEERPIKDVGEMFLLMRRLVNTDVSRLAAVMELAEVHPRLIIFYNFNDELAMLRQLSDILDIEVGEWNGQKHQDIPTGTRWIYLVQYTAGSEGWNCVTTDAMVFWSLSYSYRVTEQAKGRIDRMNTPYKDLNYYFLRSPSMIDQAIWRAIQYKQEFNERRFALTMEKN